MKRGNNLAAPDGCDYCCALDGCTHDSNSREDERTPCAAHTLLRIHAIAFTHDYWISAGLDERGGQTETNGPKCGATSIVSILDESRLVVFFDRPRVVTEDSSTSTRFFCLPPYICADPREC